jgi:hypothetical protein
MKLGAALQLYGSPVPRTEAVLAALAAQLDVKGCDAIGDGVDGCRDVKLTNDIFDPQPPLPYKANSTSCPTSSSAPSAPIAPPPRRT